MACNCPPCSLDPAALLAKVRELFAARLKQAFHNRTLGCQATAGSHWWDGHWLPYEGHWTGHNHEAVGDFSLITVQDLTISVTICFHTVDLGPWQP
ncbi:MAG: hypothetical protein Q4E43_05285 [Akkermansia sp.]|nr:hypothetical protein [Akkermansia sp.]